MWCGCGVDVVCCVWCVGDMWCGCGMLCVVWRWYVVWMWCYGVMV